MLYKSRSQNHRTFRITKGLWRSYSPKPLPEQGHPEKVTQERIQGCLQRGRIHALPRGLNGKSCGHTGKHKTHPRWKHQHSDCRTLQAQGTASRCPYTVPAATHHPAALRLAEPGHTDTGTHGHPPPAEGSPSSWEPRPPPRA